MTAQDKGWGDRNGSAVINAQVVVEAGGIKLRCHRAIAPLVRHCLAESVRRGYRFNLTKDDWGYCNRCVRGTGPGTSKPCSPSNHSWGLALDVNATTNPMTSDGVVHTDMPDWLVQLWKSWGFFWGGGYSHSRKDPMHFEFLGGPADAKRLVAALTRQPAARPPVKPAGRPASRPAVAAQAAKAPAAVTLPAQRRPAPRRNPYKPQPDAAVVAIGAHGDHVSFVQWALRISVDGDFGPGTRDALKRFQKAHGLGVDGKAGPKTLALLKVITR